jgi:RecJ-like exonuclease
MEGERATCPQCHGRMYVDGKKCSVCEGVGEIRVRKSTIQVMFPASDVRRVKVNCRCGEKSTVEIPDPLKYSLVLHNCPSCQRPFTVQFFDGSGWKIRRGEAPKNAVRLFPSRSNSSVN